jgi:hypothetical protein
MEKGTVFYHANFVFKDGAVGDKLLIVLNNQSNNAPFLCCKTTSKKKWGIDQDGCHSSKNIFVMNHKPFNKKTWIQFDPNSVFEFSAADLLKQKFGGNIKVVGRIDDQNIRAIANCFKKSEDISAYHCGLLAK